MSRALLRQSWCNSCRHETVRSFLSVSGVSIPRYSLPLSPIYTGNRRAFSLASRLRSENSTLENPDSKVSAEEKKEPVDNALSTPAQAIPWYLQADAAEPEPTTVSSRDQLPDIPENPPPILPPLLDYAFKDLGLDNLKLVDLRELDIPTGLGANVIMAIGTARSVKHLNVAADRLCRWMRTSWKLTPYADGLLGRNELKIKLRRKTRRARAATQAGATYEERDDGITTGWICVNAGVVQEDPDQLTLHNQGVEGFGNLGRGVRLVVQVFTEEKRAEVDLEGLWTKRLARAERDKKNSLDGSSNAPQEVRDPATETAISSDHDFRHLPRTRTTFLLEQRRGVHTRRRRRSKDGVEMPRSVAESVSPDAKHRLARRDNAGPTTLASRLTMDSLIGYLSSFHDNRARHELGPGKEDRAAGAKPVSPEAEHRLSQGNNAGLTIPASGLTMASLFGYLSSLRDNRARSELGTGEEDCESTLFLRRFYGLQAELSPEQGALARIQLLCAAISRGHPSYSKETLWKAFKEHGHCNYPVTDDLGLQVLSAMLTERRSTSRLRNSDIELAMRVCDNLCLRGTDLLNMKVFNMLYKAASPKRKRAKTHKKPVLDRIPRIVEAFEIPFDPKESRIFMWMLFQNREYEMFWKLWHQIPLNGGSRTADDYKTLFRVHAELCDAHRARDCVSRCVPMMEQESPPVEKHFAIMKHVEACQSLGHVEEDQLVQLQKRLLDEEVDPWL